MGPPFSSHGLAQARSLAEAQPMTRIRFEYAEALRVPNIWQEQGRQAFLLMFKNAKPFSGQNHAKPDGEPL